MELPLLNSILEHLLLSNLVLFILIMMRRLTEILALNSSKISRFCISHWVYYRLETCLLVLIPRFCLGSYWPILLTLLLLIIYYQNSFIFLSLGHGPLSGWDTGLLTFLTSCMDIQNLPIFIFLGVFFLILFIFFVFLTFIFIFIVFINILVLLLVFFQI